MIILEEIKSKAVMKPANLFFIELIVVLLFFSFSAAVILSVFAAADYRQRKSDMIEQAVICSQSVAEAFSVTGDFAEAAEIVFGKDVDGFDGSAAQLRLDNHMKLSDNGEVILSVKQWHRETEAGRLSGLEFGFSSDGEELFSPVICQSYFPDTGGTADE